METKHKPARETFQCNYDAVVLILGKDEYVTLTQHNEVMFYIFININMNPVQQKIIQLHCCVN